MLQSFSHIPNLSLQCSILHLDENDVESLAFIIGKYDTYSQGVVDILVGCGFIESKSRFRKNPQTIRINGEVISPDTILEKGEYVLSIGKGSSFQCRYIIIK